MLTNVKYRSRYSFSMIFVSQKSQFKTQNSQLKIPKVPPLEKNCPDFLQILTSGKMQKNAVFVQFNVCLRSKVALLHSILGRFGVQRRLR